jgi:hypothetical protein
MREKSETKVQVGGEVAVAVNNKSQSQPGEPELRRETSLQSA